MTLSIIVAMTDERVIGRDNRLPWHLSDDLKRFKRLTMGHPILMGRKTFESIGKPLPGRTNIVVSRNPGWSHPGVTVARDMELALSQAEKEGDGFVIGGAALFQAALPVARRLYLTMIHELFEGDVRFPEFDLAGQFVVTEKSDHVAEGSHPIRYSFVTAERRR